VLGVEAALDFLHAIDVGKVEDSKGNFRIRLEMDDGGVASRECRSARLPEFFFKLHFVAFDCHGSPLFTAHDRVLDHLRIC